MSKVWKSIIIAIITVVVLGVLGGGIYLAVNKAPMTETPVIESVETLEATEETEGSLVETVDETTGETDVPVV